MPHATPGRPVAARTVNVYVDGYNFYVPLSDRPAREYELAWCNFWKLGENLVRALGKTRPHEFANAQLGVVKYFTATIPEGMPQDRGGVHRKHDWLDALHTATGGRVHVVHGTFARRRHGFFVDSDSIADLVRSGVPVDWNRLGDQQTFRARMSVCEEKQTDVMLACSLVTDAALGSAGPIAPAEEQKPPDHRTNTRPEPSACNAAVVISSDIDVLPAAEIAAGLFHCPTVVAFAYPQSGYCLLDRESRRFQNLSTYSIEESELRAAMLPREIVVEPGRTVTLEHFVRTHFQRVHAMGG
jgi:hypothetical protein